MKYIQKEQANIYISCYTYIFIVNLSFYTSSLSFMYFSDPS
jgi:hypothetical protein